MLGIFRYHSRPERRTDLTLRNTDQREMNGQDTEARRDPLNSSLVPVTRDGQKDEVRKGTGEVPREQRRVQVREGGDDEQATD